MTKITILVVACLDAISPIFAQNGSIQITFTPQNGNKPTSLQVAVPFFKFDNAHGYWFVNPHNGSRHLQFKPDRGWADKNLTVGFVTLNETKDDFFFYDGNGNDSDEIALKNNSIVISAPGYNARGADKKTPLHVHINSFTASECSFTISGGARLITIKDNNNSTEGTITGNAHFYREPKYEKSDPLPGCDCDATIYGTLYDAENDLRTTSACENALRNKIFDAVQKAVAPLFSNIAFKGKVSTSAGNINIVMLPGHADINVPVKDRQYCSSDYRHNWLTGFSSHKTFFTSDDTYGLRLIKMPSATELNGGSADPNIQKKQTARRDSLLKEVVAGKITATEFTKAMDDFNQQNGIGTQDYKKMEMNHNLTVQIIFNPANKETMLLKLGDKNNTRVEHNVKGAAYEVFSGQFKDNDGSWIGNRLFIYMGKYDAPVLGKSGGGFDAEISKAIYPANGNRLGVYNIIIKLEGDKEMADKAIANIDFETLQKLITHQ